LKQSRRIRFHIHLPSVRKKVGYGGSTADFEEECKPSVDAAAAVILLIVESNSTSWKQTTGETLSLKGITEEEKRHQRHQSWNFIM
jgi:hypothetical protein